MYLGHIDDSLLVGQSFNSSHKNIADTVCLFTNVGFTIHRVKSVLKPQKKIDFLGFVLDSEQHHYACQNLLLQKAATVSSVVQAIGFLVSSFPILL